MGKRKRILLKSLPYVVALFSGISFYHLALVFDNEFHDLLIGLSATFIAIPILYLVYEIVSSYSQRKLNSEIYTYAKSQIDGQLLSILLQLQKTVFTLERRDKLLKGVNDFRSISKAEIEDTIKENIYIGFQIYKTMEISENYLHETLKNPFILEKLEDEQIIAIIRIIRNLSRFEAMQKQKDLFVETGEKAKDLKIQRGVDINPDNEFPDRCLLLKHISGDKYIVHDFGDIPKYNIEKCLFHYKINTQQSAVYSSIIFDLLDSINEWINITGNKFILRA
jgi:hypothetical protein